MPGLEAQLAALADDVAYVNHDIDDGLRAGLFTLADLAEAPLAGPHAVRVRERYGALELRRLIGELIRTLMGALIDDILTETRARLAVTVPISAAEVRAAGRALASFSPGMAAEVASLKQFLFARMYRHPRVATSMARAQAVVTELFAAFAVDPGLMPTDWTNWARGAATARDSGARLYRRHDRQLRIGGIPPYLPYGNCALD